MIVVPDRAGPTVAQRRLGSPPGPAAPGAGGDTRRVPVVIDLPAALAAEVTAWGESEAGWEVVAAHGPVAPSLRLVELTALTIPGAAPTEHHGLGRAAVGTPAAAAVGVTTGPLDEVSRRRALAAGALDVVRWPEERGRLLDAPGRVAAPAAPVAVPVLRVGATGGGVGASTVALALGGLLAWSGRRALVVGGNDLLRLCGLRWRGPGARELAALDAVAAAQELPALVWQAPGVPGLSLLGGEADSIGSTAGWPVDVVVVDVGTALPERCEVVLARADASIDRAGEVGARRVLLAEGGLLPPAAAAERVGRHELPRLAASQRVARAGLRGRVPADLPGRWLAELATACELPASARAAAPMTAEGGRGRRRRRAAR